MNRLPQNGYPLGTMHFTRGEAPVLTTPQQQTFTQPAYLGYTSPLTPQPYGSLPTFPPSSAAAPRILVIDDSPTIRRIMEVCHRRAGFSIQTFADGVEAFQWLFANPSLIPSLIYLDIEMPRLDGFEVARQLRSRPAFADVPLLMLSGRDKTLDRIKGLLAGAKGYVTKPFREQDILALTRSYVSPGRAE